MKSPSLYAMLIVCMLATSCRHTLVESEYTFDGRTIHRKDWDHVMTELRYYDRDGNEMGTALFYYPGRDGWFLVDNIWDTNKIYLLLCDACPKISIIDSAHFSVIHDTDSVKHIDKSRWIRMTDMDDVPVVRKQNKEYNSKIQKTNKPKQKCSNMPDWDGCPGVFWSVNN